VAGTYAGHELENGVLRLVEQHSDLVKALQHSGIVTDSTCHASSQLSAQAVVDVELVWRARRKESVV
jgi:hypothetical protein